MLSGPRLQAVSDRYLQGFTILVVEDHYDSRELLVTILEGLGATVHAAEVAKDAFELLSRHRPDLVISDIGLPGEDGESLVRRIRALPQSAGGLTPAIALTAYASGSRQHAAMGAGFQFYLTKPLDIGKLLQAIERCIRPGDGS